MRELRFEGVSVRYGSRRGGFTAVDGVDLTVPAGEIVGLVGESGSGKSTLARAAVGLLPVHSGRILLGGESPRQRTGARRPVQMVFQDPYASLDPRMTVGASIAETLPRRFAGGPKPAGAAKSDRQQEVSRLLERVGLAPDRAALYPRQLSGGQQQRVAIARALAAGPDVIVADEITSALDVSVQGTVLNLVRDLQRDLGVSMLFISHNLAAVRYVASSIAVMYLGRIVEHGPTREVLADPQHPYTRDLLASVPDARHTLADESDESDEPSARVVRDAEPADPHRPPAGCRYHPRCPVGPLVLPGRDVCRTTEPGRDHPHHTACHFPGGPVALPAPAVAALSTDERGDTAP
ncbi:ABC transporter ATP-binding protein [Streptomyces sp. NPDC093109]|uniref:ABC transporter ATP-binding protein n=1 Tax=Streptomyces sp. NPDC093109 TaxID=3154977 RepID=UPI00344E269F